jgi:hypothetical protein
MDVSLIIALIILMVLAYYLIYETYEKPFIKNDVDDFGDDFGADTEGTDKKIVIEEDTKVIIKSMDKHYLAVNRMARHLYLTDDKSRAEIFKIIVDPTNKKSPKIFLMIDDGHYINLKYTPFSKKEYDVRVNVNEKINTARLKLIKNSKGICIKFSNGFYLTIFKGSLYSSRDKSRIFYFKFLSR